MSERKLIQPYSDKNDQLFALMDAQLNKFQTGALEEPLQPAGSPRGWMEKDKTTTTDQSLEMAVDDNRPFSTIK